MPAILSSQANKTRWALARLTFILYISFSVVTLVGGFATAPLMTWYFLGDWRFWRHWRTGARLLPHGLRILRLMLADSRFFMFSVPLTSAPRSRPEPGVARLNPNWPQGSSCGDCSNCCRPGGYACPLLDEQQDGCQGYDSFYWRYFNCGRFPSVRQEVDYYACKKWVVAPAHPALDSPQPACRVVLESANDAGFDLDDDPLRDHT